MNKRSFYLPNKDIEDNVALMEVFGYKLISNKRRFYHYAKLKYEKDEPIYSSEMKNNPRFVLPFFILIICAILVVGLATAFLVTYIVFKDNPSYNKYDYFMALMLPAFVLVLVSTGLGIWRYFSIFNNIKIYSSISYIKSEVENEKAK